MDNVAPQEAPSLFNLTQRRLANAGLMDTRRPACGLRADVNGHRFTAHAELHNGFTFICNKGPIFIFYGCLAMFCSCSGTLLSVSPDKPTGDYLLSDKSRSNTGISDPSFLCGSVDRSMTGHQFSIKRVLPDGLAWVTLLTGIFHEAPVEWIITASVKKQL